MQQTNPVAAFRSRRALLIAIAILMFAHSALSAAPVPRVALQSDTGNWMTRCRNCQKTVDGKFPDTVTVHVTKPTDRFAQFDVFSANGKIAFKSDNGLFVTRCRNCIVGGAYPDSATIHVKSSSEKFAQFAPQLLENGKYALQADTGKYVTRCRNCSPGAAYEDTVTVHASQKDKFAHWRIIPITFPTGSKIALQDDMGGWFTRCRNCQKTVGGKFPDTVTTHVKNPNEKFARFEVVDVGGGKIALKADSGKYVTRCRNCIVGGAYEDSVTIHVDNPNGSFAQFTPEMVADGKYALKSDNGKYLARCRNCSPGAAYPDTVTVHAKKTDSFAHWNIIYLP